MNTNNDWESSNAVVAFYNSKTIDVNTMVSAYYERDVGMGLIFNEVATNALDKLGYTSESVKRIIKNRFRNKMKMMINDLLNETNSSTVKLSSLPDQYKEYFQSNEIQNLISVRNTRLNELTSFVNNNDHLGFYSNMTVNELSYLGW